MSTFLRAATPADYTYFARLFPELGTGDSVATEDRWRDELAKDVLFLEDDGDIVGYTLFQVLADTGYIRHIVVDPRDRRKGYGRHIRTGVRERLRAAGRKNWCLNVRTTNTGAIALYESVGMQFAYYSSAMRLTWSQARRSNAPDIDVTPFESNEDTTVERAFSLPLGQVSDHRTKSERVFLKAKRGPELCGFAVFDRLFPGVYPFCVHSNEAAWKILEAVQHAALPTDDHIRLLVDDNKSFCDALTEAGAETLLSVAHYRGLV